MEKLYDISDTKYDVAVDKEDNDQLMFEFTGTGVREPPEFHSKQWNFLVPLSGTQLQFSL